MDYQIKREQFLQNGYLFANFFRLLPKFNLPNIIDSPLASINPAQIQNNLILNSFILNQQQQQQQNQQQQSKIKTLKSNQINTKRFDYSKLAQECSNSSNEKQSLSDEESPTKSMDYSSASMSSNGKNTNMVKINNNFSRY